MKALDKTDWQLLNKASRPIDPELNWFFTHNRNKRSSDRYRDFVEKAADGFAEFNVKGECIFCNEAAHRLLGYTREEYMKLSCCQRCGSRATAEQYSLVYDDLLREDLSQKIYETEIKRKDGNIAIHQISVSTVKDEDGHTTGFRVISRDVTENRKMMKEQTRMADFVQSAEEGCYELDLGGNLIFCNNAFMKITGYTLQEYSELKLSKRHPTRKAADISAKMFHAVYQTGKHAQGVIYEILRKDGEKRTIETSISLIRDKAGTPTGYRGICRDITDKKKMALEQARLKKQLIHSQKLEAVGTLASGIAHDFNNLLMGIQGYTSLLLMGKDIEHADYEKIKAIEQMVKSGADLTRQILGYARGNHSRLIPVNMNELIGKTVDIFGRTRKDLHIDTGLDPDLYLIEANRGQMEQALLNLLVNAWQAMPDGGEILLESCNVTVDEAFAKSNAIAAGRYIRVSIRDDGTGMDEWTKNKIFEPFFSTKEAGRGTGLGLTTVNHIIRAHKGTIQVSSRKGDGSTFSIYLPASARKRFRNDEKKGSEIICGHETILLVDDEQVIREVTGDLLTTLGYKVLIARNGEEAVKIYEEQHHDIMVVILDMIMPDMGGGAVFVKLKSLHPNAKIILSSGCPLNDTAKAIMRQGCRSFLQKPYRLEELSGTIRRLIDEQ